MIPRFVTAYPIEQQRGEVDTVVLARDVPEHGLEKGDVGAVVHRYEPRCSYEVEFVTVEGKTIAVLTLTSEDVRPMSGDEILHARGLVSLQG